ncbi:MAG: hypothetical protein QOE72_616, partial [Chloroflexota bacterium]|nr:hypothetical protein [Chloroflexota bacterium]
MSGNGEGASAAAAGMADELLDHVPEEPPGPASDD